MFKVLIPIWVSLGSVFSGCLNNKEVKNDYSYQIKKFGHLPDEILESSGLVILPDNRIYTHSDGGNAPALYELSMGNEQLTFHKEIALPFLENNDWEDITMDPDGNVYIGDFGNNDNSSENLSIYVLDSALNFVRTISYKYPDQVAFPPETREEKNYDCEAFFWLNNRLYFFSKNVKWPYTHIYEMNLLHENQMQLIDSLYLDSPITAADVRPDGNEAVLLSYGKLFFVTVQTENDSISFTLDFCKKFGKSGQSEAIAYVNRDQVLISNENGKVFLLSREPTMKK